MRMIDQMLRPFRVLRFFGLLLCCMLYASELREQEDEASATPQELWTGAAVKYEFLPRYSAQLHHEQRFRTDGFVLDKNFTELELKHKWKSGFSLAGGLRYIRTTTPRVRSRASRSATVGRPIWAINLISKDSASERASGSSREGSLKGTTRSVNALRWKLALGYNIRKWKLDPKLSTELFKRTDKQESITKMRLTLGSEYSMGEWGSALFYRMEEDFTANERLLLTKGICI